MAKSTYCVRNVHYTVEYPWTEYYYKVQLCFEAGLCNQLPDRLWENIPVHPHQLLCTWERGNRKWAIVNVLKQSGTLQIQSVNVLPTV